MNRLNRYLWGALAALLAAAAPALCANLPFNDDFTDVTYSRTKWSGTHNRMSAAVAGGTVTVENTSTNQNEGAEYLHEFDAPKPTVFTVSVVLKSFTKNRAGLYFCRKDNNYNGYIISIEDGSLLVLKYVAGSGKSIHYEPGLGIKTSDNKLTVSKNGSLFNLFLNDVFQGSFEDAEFASGGDVSLFVPQQSTAVFSDFSMTDKFTAAPTGFSDDFGGTALKSDWRFLGDAKPTLGNGALSAAVASDKDMYMYVRRELTDFEAGVDVRHIAGSTSAFYGLVLIGEPGADRSYPIVYFWISGSQDYSIYNNKTEEINSTIKHSNKILGSAGNLAVVWIDKLKIKKAQGSSTYELIINGETISSAHPAADFKITGIGLICQGGQTIAFDNFYVEKDGPPTSVNRDSKQISRAKPMLTTRDHTFYDMRGRKRYSITSTPSRIQTRAAGVYVNKNGRDVAVRKGRVATE